MRRTLAKIVVALLALALVAPSIGCTSSSSSSRSDDYYRRGGTIHQDSFPGAYGGSRYGRYGRYGPYGRY